MKLLSTLLRRLFVLWNSLIIKNQRLYIYIVGSPEHTGTYYFYDLNREDMVVWPDRDKLIKDENEIR